MHPNCTNGKTVATRSPARSWAEVFGADQEFWGAGQGYPGRQMSTCQLKWGYMLNPAWKGLMHIYFLLFSFQYIICWDPIQGLLNLPHFLCSAYYNVLGPLIRPLPKSPLLHAPHGSFFCHASTNIVIKKYTCKILFLRMLPKICF